MTRRLAHVFAGLCCAVIAGCYQKVSENGGLVFSFQPWVPLLMDWQITVLKAPAYAPGSGVNTPVFTFGPANWSFDGTDYDWVGPTTARGEDFSESESAQLTLRGRTFLTPQLNFTLAAQLDEWVRKHSVRDPALEALLKDLDAYLDSISGQDILSQRLSGLRALLVQRGKLSRAEEGGATSWSAAGVAKPIPRELRHLPEVRWTKIGLLSVIALVAIAGATEPQLRHETER